MKYVEIENGSVIKVWNMLPGAWRNISGFQVLSDSQLSNLAWAGHPECSFLPLVEDSYPNQDKRFWNILGPNYEVRSNDVLQTWTVTSKTDEECWEAVRLSRNQRLLKCDWTQLSDSPLTVEKKAEYVQYRQALRDITLQPDPKNIIWPTEPII